MANRKAGSADGGKTGEAKRPAAGRKSADTNTGAAEDQATAGGGATAGGRKRATKAATGGDTAAESQPAKTTKRATAKSASKASAAAADQDSGGKGVKSAAKKSASRGGGKPDLRKDLRQFVSENPNGWGHEQWEGLLAHLGQRGHDTSNPNQIGMQLERERLSSRLEGIEGVSAQRARSIAERFGTLYSLRNADVDDIAREANVSRDVAERIKHQLQ